LQDEIIPTEQNYGGRTMNSIMYSRHGRQRMQQRGIREKDIDLVMACGTEIDGGSIILSNKDATREIQHRRHEIQALERLRGCRAVIRDGVLVTCYQARQKQLKNLRQRGN
jgi:Domain of unknown function (DUF4258)